VATSKDRTNDLRRRKAVAEAGGGEARKKAQHERGKMTARERLDQFFDENSFNEVDALVEHRCRDFNMDRNVIPGDGVVCGHGTVSGRPVFGYAQDFTVYGGSLGEMHGLKICKILDMAMKAGAPVVGFNDSGGARIQEGVASLGSYAEIFYRNVRASGVIPQISVILGPCAGGAVYSPAITDFVIMAEGTAHMFITGPEVIRTVTNEIVSFEELGGAQTHASRSGVAHLTAEDDESAISLARQLLNHVPCNNLEQAPNQASSDVGLRNCPELAGLIPEDPNKPYDVHDVITSILDRGGFLEIQPEWAKNMVIGFGHLGEKSIGVVANQPNTLAGCIDIDAAVKSARFVRFCDAFNIPLLTLVDVPGFLPGSSQEWGGIIRHGAKLLYAFSEATVPKMTVILRKAYGGAYDVMCSKHLRGDYNIAWPSARLAVMGAEGAVEIIHKRRIAHATDSEGERQRLIDDYDEQFANPWTGASLGYLDDVIDPTETRNCLIKALGMLGGKEEARPSRKHGNIPL